MSRLGAPRELEAWREAIKKSIDPDQPRLRICDGTGCRALGSQELLAALNQALEAASLKKQVVVIATGCPGFCEQGPLVTVDLTQRPSQASIAYHKVSPGDAQAIVTETLKADRLIQELLYTDPDSNQPIIHEADLPFYSRQTRRVMALNGKINPLTDTALCFLINRKIR